VNDKEPDKEEKPSNSIANTSHSSDITQEIVIPPKENKNNL
jgi:hypothetical protein